MRTIQTSLSAWAFTQSIKRDILSADRSVQSYFTKQQKLKLSDQTALMQAGLELNCQHMPDGPLSYDASHLSCCKHRFMLLRGIYN